ncbi:hypothetical protein PISMIDRAFT_682858 [Pisolithus microcarpus 441]|uniref:Uncharacterized protein n=1 Tax=Pisolithus microcarpus 441 TaxID=765257 RepID=A0A0C9YSL1_9AGAM|nr:hypothetical protein PISMIDRAFT_682858 [Pisolithus microcarpus 441]
MTTACLYRERGVYRRSALNQENCMIIVEESSHVRCSAGRELSGWEKWVWNNARRLTAQCHTRIQERSSSPRTEFFVFR